MKKYISVCMLIVRSSIYQVLGVLLGSVIANGISYFLRGWPRSDLYEAVSRIDTLYLGVILMSVFLSRSLCKGKGQLSYTMRRLRISDKAVFGIQAGYNALCFALLFAVHALCFLGMSLLYLKGHPEASHQTLFVTAYQYEIFHVVFPLENTVGWVCNGILIAGLGICTAAYPFRQRRGRRSITTFLMVGVVLFYLFIIGEDHHLGSSGAAYCVPAALLFIGSSAAGVLGIEEEVYE